MIPVRVPTVKQRSEVSRGCCLWERGELRRTEQEEAVEPREISEVRASSIVSASLDHGDHRGFMPTLVVWGEAEEGPSAHASCKCIGWAPWDSQTVQVTTMASSFHRNARLGISPHQSLKNLSRGEEEESFRLSRQCVFSAFNKVTPDPHG